MWTLIGLAPLVATSRTQWCFCTRGCFVVLEAGRRERLCGLLGPQVRNNVKKPIRVHCKRLKPHQRLHINKPWCNSPSISPLPLPRPTSSLSVNRLSPVVWMWVYGQTRACSVGVAAAVVCLVVAGTLSAVETWGAMDATAHSRLEEAFNGRERESERDACGARGLRCIPRI